MKKEEDGDENKIIKFVQIKGDDYVIGFSLSSFFLLPSLNSPSLLEDYENKFVI